MEKISRDVKDILSKICQEHSHNLTFSEAKEALQTLSQLSDDFTFELDGNEYRVIADDAIWDIYVETIKEIVNDCYDLKLDSIPDFIALEIDWEQTAVNAYADGYGHTFSSYDGSECETKNHYIFRTN